MRVSPKFCMCVPSDTDFEAYVMLAGASQGLIILETAPYEVRYTISWRARWIFAMSLVRKAGEIQASMSDFADWIAFPHDLEGYPFAVLENCLLSLKKLACIIAVHGITSSSLHLANRQLASVLTVTWLLIFRESVISVVKLFYQSYSRSRFKLFLLAFTVRCSMVGCGSIGR